MYKPRSPQLSLLEATLVDMFELDPKNRWVERAKCVPWELAEKKYEHMFRKNGRPAKDIRMALGALLIKEFLGCSDEEVVENIRENPYMQHFIGLKRFTNVAPFDASLMVWFRKRISHKFLAEINEEMCRAAAQPTEEIPPQDEDDIGKGGTMIVDATCTPADIRYPTDTGLLAEAIEKTDQMIDEMHEPHKGERARPRTYRVKSRQLKNSFNKRRKPSAKLIRKVKGKQLNFLRRNLKAINQMKAQGGTLTPRQERLLTTIETMYEQQREMHTRKENRVQDRIVSLSQPHIRPIVRGKAGKPTEFGAKIAASVVKGYVFLNEISYDAFNESETLDNMILDYYCTFGLLPARILAATIFSTKDNRDLCKVLGIKLISTPLGKKKIEKETVLEGESLNEVEGSFGTLKSRYGWSRIMAHLPETGMTAISLAAFAMNLSRMARFLWLFFRICFLPIKLVAKLY